MITITNISKAYAATPVLEGCSLQVPDGAIYALAGRNGAGKSTLLKLAASALISGKSGYRESRPGKTGKVSRKISAL